MDFALERLSVAGCVLACTIVFGVAASGHAQLEQEFPFSRSNGVDFSEGIQTGQTQSQAERHCRNAQGAWTLLCSVRSAESGVALIRTKVAKSTYPSRTPTAMRWLLNEQMYTSSSRVDRTTGDRQDARCRGRQVPRSFPARKLCNRVGIEPAKAVLDRFPFLGSMSKTRCVSKGNRIGDVSRAPGPGLYIDLSLPRCI